LSFIEILVFTTVSWIFNTTHAHTMVRDEHCVWSKRNKRLIFNMPPNSRKTITMIPGVVYKAEQQSIGGDRAVLESNRCLEPVEMHSHWVGLWKARKT